MRKLLALAAGVCFASTLVYGQASHTKGHFISFDVPGASTASMPGTFPQHGTIVVDMNEGGEIIGTFTTDSTTMEVKQAFLRTKDGKTRVINDPSAGTVGNQWYTVGMYPYSINAGGVIVGMYYPDSGSASSFIRSINGTFKDFAVLDANGWYQDQTEALSINARGQITGDFLDYNGVTHAFIRNFDGTVVSFEAPHAYLSGFWNGTTSVSINKFGAVCGQYRDANVVIHPFLRDKDGDITEFDVPGAGTAPYTGAFTYRITDDGTVLGFTWDNNYQSKGFVRFPNGQVWNENFPQIPDAQNFFIETINDRGDLMGTYTDGAGAIHTFVLTRRGELIHIDAANAGSGQNQGTIGINMNNAGDVAGYYFDANNIAHGYFWSRGERTNTNRITNSRIWKAN